MARRDGAAAGADVRGWEEIRAAIRARIEARDWVPGALIPTEAELAAEYGVARATVNRALRDLAAGGLLERRRRAGTRVAIAQVRRAVLAIPVIRREVEATGKAHAFQLLERVEATPPPVIALRMGIAPGQRLLRLETLHLADGQAFALEARWLNPAAVPGPLPDFTRLTANEWLVETVPYATGEIAFAAEAASAREAAVLGCTEGAALFVTERATRTEAAPVTFVRLAHAPGYRMRSAL